MTGITGNPCRHPGVYISVDGCQERMTLLLGDSFPACRRCGRVVTWRLDRNAEVKHNPLAR
jgi:hypothetical protein